MAYGSTDTSMGAAMDVVGTHTHTVGTPVTPARRAARTARPVGSPAGTVFGV